MGGLEKETSRLFLLKLFAEVGMMLTSLFILFYLFSLYIANSTNTDLELNVFLSFVLPLAIFVFLLYQYVRLVQYINKLADHQARNLIEGRKKTAEFVVYLRPFLIDGKITSYSSELVSDIKNFLTFGVASFTSFEKDLLSVLRKRYTLIRFDYEKEKFSLGPIKFIKSLFTLRAGRYIDSSPAWFENLEKVLEKAKYIIVVPPIHLDSATAMEIQKIVASKDLRQKSIFVMTGSGFRFDWKRLRKIKGRKIWENLVSIAGKYMGMPSHKEGGGWVIPINGNHVLVDGLQGRPWLHKSVLQYVFKIKDDAYPVCKNSCLYTFNVYFKFPFHVFIFAFALWKMLENDFGFSVEDSFFSFYICISVGIYFFLIYQYLKLFGYNRKFMFFMSGSIFFLNVAFALITDRLSVDLNIRLFESSLLPEWDDINTLEEAYPVLYYSSILIYVLLLYAFSFCCTYLFFMNKNYAVHSMSGARS